MAWGPPMPLTIAQPQSTRFVEIAKTAWLRRSPIIEEPNAEARNGFPSAGEAKSPTRRGPRAPFVCYRNQFQPHGAQIGRAHV